MRRPDHTGWNTRPAGCRAEGSAPAASGRLAHLWLVPNPAHNPHGDFGLSPDGLALNLPPAQALRCARQATGSGSRESTNQPCGTDSVHSEALPTRVIR